MHVREIGVQEVLSAEPLIGFWQHLIMNVETDRQPNSRWKGQHGDTVWISEPPRDKDPSTDEGDSDREPKQPRKKKAMQTKKVYIV